MSTVVGIFKDEMDAINSMEELLDMGYENKDFSVFKKDEVKHTYLLGKSLNEDPNGIYKKDQTIDKGRTMDGLVLGLEAHRVLDIFPVIGAGPLATNMRYDLATKDYTPMESLSHLGAAREDIEVYEKSLHLDYILIAVDTTVIKKPEIERVFRENNSILKNDIDPEFNNLGLDRRYKSALDEKIKEREPGVDKSMHPEVKDSVLTSDEGIDKSMHPEVEKRRMDKGSGVDSHMKNPDNRHIRDRDDGVDPHIKHK